MEVKIQISDVVYATLLNGPKRIQGTIALVNPNEGNFNAHLRNKKTDKRIYMKLPHGRVSINDDDVRLTMKVNWDNHLHPSAVMEEECVLACDYVDLMEHTCLEELS